jgi:hypothetical protein
MRQGASALGATIRIRKVKSNGVSATKLVSNLCRLDPNANWACDQKVQRTCEHNINLR